MEGNIVLAIREISLYPSHRNLGRERVIGPERLEREYSVCDI
jgi:hypothetical protein